MSQYLYNALNFVFVDHIREFLFILMVCNVLILKSNMRLMKELHKLREGWFKKQIRYQNLLDAVAFYARKEHIADIGDGYVIPPGDRIATDAYEMAIKVETI